LAAAGVPHRIYSYHRFNDAEILQQARQDLRAGAAETFFLYLSELDHFLHLHRPDPHQVRQRLAWYEARVRELYNEAASCSSDLVFSVFSDHGMAPVRDNCDVVADVESLGFRMPADYLAVYDSTMARFWFFSDRVRQAVTARLRQNTGGRILADSELRRLGVFFEDRRFGELVFLLNAGNMIFRSDFGGSRWTPSGMHGYHPDDADSDAVFLSNHAPCRPLCSIADLHAHMIDSTALGKAAHTV
jgi:predicted AlkP superfamily pyrophosphatase or phosphodiesterase